MLSSTLHADDLSFNTPYTLRMHTASQIMRHRIFVDRQGVFVIDFSTSSVQENETDSYWNIRLIDSQLKTVVEMSISGDADRQSSARLRLPMGYYDLRITPGSSFSPAEFTLVLLFESELDILVEREPNDHPLNATPIEAGRTILGNAQDPKDVDIFVLRVGEPGYLTVQLEADRVLSGHHWSIALQRGTQEIIPLLLDHRLNQSEEIRVSAGSYYIYVTAAESDWSDADYRLTSRFTPLGQENPVDLTLGEYRQGVVFPGEQGTAFLFTYSEEDQGSAALRWRSMQESPGFCSVVLFNDISEVVWEAKIAASERVFAALLPDLSSGEYHLNVMPHEGLPETTYAFELGIFLAMQLPLRLELQIGNADLMVNGVRNELDPGFSTTPILLHDRTMLPIRSIVAAFGGVILWEEETERVSIICNGHRLELIIGEDVALLDGIRVSVGVAPLVLGGRTMLPLRFIGEALGCLVEWIEDGERIIIYN